MLWFSQHLACASKPCWQHAHSPTNVNLLPFQPFCHHNELPERVIASLVFCWFLFESEPPERPSCLNPGRYSLRRVPLSSRDYRPAETERQWRDDEIEIEGEGKWIKGRENSLRWRQPCAQGRKWRLQNPLDSQARTVRFPGSQLLYSTRFRSILPPQRCLRAPIHLPIETEHQHFIDRIWWLHQTQSKETYVTHVYIEGGTPGYRAAGVAVASWCASAAEALWLASPPYHSRLLKVRKMNINLVLSKKP